MAIKSMSTRANICGRGAGCKGGHSAVEQASYIGREKMYCQYDGLAYYPKYSEDLVHNEVILPENAPTKYKNPSVLWNSVEMFEKSSNAQLARTYKVELPNEWSYDLAVEVMRDYVRRDFVNKGMCAQFAIHDSENTQTGQRNLHCHVMLTLRSLDEQGRWMPKQKKVYLSNENGERIPLIDKKTGLQKVDKQNRKQWKCATVDVNDWNSKEKAKIWRKDLADTINCVNARLGMTENFWEHRSFKDQGLENAVIEAARVVYEKAKEGLRIVKAVPVAIGTAIKNEVIEVIRAVAKRNREKLSLPIIGGKYLRLITNRALLQDKDYMERFVSVAGITTFDELEDYKKEREDQYSDIASKRSDMRDRKKYLEELLKVYKNYEPYIKYHKEQWELKGWNRKKYERKHMVELAFYDTYRNELKGMIKEPDKRILAGAWRKELDSLNNAYNQYSDRYAEIVNDLACVEVLQHNRKELERLLENESHKRTIREKSVEKNSHPMYN